MKKTVTVTTEKNVTLEEFYVIRGIVDNCMVKRVIAEKQFKTLPTAEDVAQFLVETKADFASVVSNYRLAKS